MGEVRACLHMRKDIAGEGRGKHPLLKSCPIKAEIESSAKD